MKHVPWLVGALLLFPQLSAPQAQFVPVDKPKPFWDRCEDIVPSQRTDDGSTFHQCLDEHGKWWEIVDRPISKQCTSVVPREPDKYQHFLCEDKYELLVRPEAKHAPATPSQAPMSNSESGVSKP